jgi:hypothetical protein
MINRQANSSTEQKLPNFQVHRGYQRLQASFAEMFFKNIFLAEAQTCFVDIIVDRSFAFNISAIEREGVYYSVHGGWYFLLHQN